jgi:hypothetical protein
MSVPIRSIKNQYRGINPLLHDRWQPTKEWNAFHQIHIGDLTKLLRQALIPLGYTTYNVESLQNRGNLRQYPSDERSGYSVREMIDYAVQILDRRENKKPIAWIELLSVTSAPDIISINDGLSDYDYARWDLLEKGQILIELDYLTHSEHPIWAIKDIPYSIQVTDPRESFDKTTGKFITKNIAYQKISFEVDEPIPNLEIPLSGSETLSFDFNAAYQKTYEEMLYGLELDYRTERLRLPQYGGHNNQHRHLARLITVLEAANAGQDMEAAPFPLVEIPANIEEALEKFEGLKNV